MIDDIALLKQVMEQMDAEDPAVAQAAKDRAAQALADARLSFSKMAELIEQRRLLLRPRILTGIKRMDQPGMLGDSAFRDTGSALRRDGQSFYQIAEAIELSDRPAPRYEEAMRMNEPPPYQMVSEPGTSAWWRALSFVASIVFFPLLHPIRFLAIALVAILLFYGFRSFVSFGQQASGVFDRVAAVRHSADQAMSSVGSFINEYILRRPRETTAEGTAPPRPPASISSPPAQPPSATPSPPSATPQAPPAAASGPPPTAPAPSAKSVPPAPPSAAPANPPASPPSREARGKPPSKWAEDCEPEPEDCCAEPRRGAPVADDPARVLKKITPEGTPRNSRVARPCFGGVGGCSWGGGQY
jgi:hypothetical protein